MHLQVYMWLDTGPEYNKGNILPEQPSDVFLEPKGDHWEALVPIFPTGSGPERQEKLLELGLGPCYQTEG